MTDLIQSSVKGTDMTALAASTDPDAVESDVDVEIVVPVYNEEHSLEPGVRRLHDFLRTEFPLEAVITIADNASTDRTWDVAQRLTRSLDGVRAVHLDAKGRGRALNRVWSDSSARVVAYMDVDLSTDLAALLPLVAPLLSGHSDVAIGSRLSRTSRVVRGPKREFISRSYNLLLRTTLRIGVSDAQCGFKAMRVDAARVLLPHVKDTAWFWDTELLVLAERSGMRIAEVPVDWTDDPDSRVDICTTAVEDLRGIVRVGRALIRGDLPLREVRQAVGRDRSAPAASTSGRFTVQALRFAMIGVLSTLAYLVLFVLLRGSLGAQGANVLALLVTAVANTAANRRYTFEVRGSGHGKHQMQGLVVVGLGLRLTSGSLWLLGVMSAHPGRAIEVAVLIVANLVATALRFVLLRHWVFGRREEQETEERENAEVAA